MLKKYAGLTEKHWREQIVWMLTSRNYTEASKQEQCYRWKERFILHGDWDNFPYDLKINVNLYALMWEKINPDLKERKKKGIQMEIERLRKEQEALALLV